MVAITGKDRACIEIAKSLGFDINKTKGIEIRMYAGEVVTVKAEIYPDDKQLGLIGSIIKNFKLVRFEQAE